VIGDTVPEGTETFTVHLSGASGRCSSGWARPAS